MTQAGRWNSGLEWMSSGENGTEDFECVKKSVVTKTC